MYHTKDHSHMKLRTTNGLCFVVIMLLVFSACQEAKQKPKPNIVYILTDQWRATALGYSGDHNVKTPNLDKFSQEAVNFANAVSVTPVCTPHRAALMTGRYPTTTGMFLNDIYLPSEELCMAEIFKAEGYNTAYLGKWHLDGHGRHNNVALAADAAQYMTDHADEQNPFLLFISLATPHFPHGSAPKEFKEMYPVEELVLSPNVPEEWEEKTREELQGYYGHCTATDKAIGSILDKLKNLNLMENTIVVFTADHGEMMGSHGMRPFMKQLAWDESIRVPFLISYPSIGDNRGAIVNAPINTPDILPSLLALADIEIPGSIEGEDLSGLIKAPDPDADRTALVMNLCPFTSEYKYPEYRAIRTKQYTYARTPEGPGKLFNNLSDPYQMNNLLDQPQFSGLQQDLDEKLNAALKEIGDEFKTRDYYLEKWNLRLDKSSNAINYRDFDKGEGVMQTPQLK